jgi:hypothetical protein
LKESYVVLLFIFVNASEDSMDMMMCRCCARVWLMLSLVLLVCNVLCVGAQRFSAGAPVVILSLHNVAILMDH